MRRRGVGLALAVVAVVLGLELALGSYPTHSDVFYIGVQLGFFVCLTFVLFIVALFLIIRSLSTQQTAQGLVKHSSTTVTPAILCRAA